MNDGQETGKSMIPAELLTEIASGDCVLFLGLDFAESTRGGERELASALIAYSGYEGTDKSLSAVAEYIKFSFDQRSLINHVSEWIRTQYTPTDLGKRLAMLPFRTVVTTRVDPLLEDSFRATRKDFELIVKDTDLPFSTSSRALLIKIHGTIDQRETLVLTEDDYTELRFRRRALVEYIRGIYATKTILYVGFDLEQPSLRRLHQEVRRDMGDFKRRGFVVYEGPTAFQERFWERENIKVIKLGPRAFIEALERELPSSRPKHSSHSSEPTMEQRRAYAHPYKLLDGYESADAGLFFGREREASLITSRILSHPLTVLFGGSGVGKTSLIRAGLAPRLAEFGAFPIYGRCLDSPLEAITGAISRAAAEHGRGDLDATAHSRMSLVQLLMACQQAVGKRLVLFVNQFEELFRTPYDAQEELIQQIAGCLFSGAELTVRLVLGLREDYLAELNKLQHRIPFIYDNMVRLTNLSNVSAVEAIVKPLEYFDVRYEDELVEILINDLTSESSVAPTQLQIVCTRLYESYADQEIITVEHYRGSGGARAILGSYIEEALRRFSVLDRKIAGQVLKSLVGPEGVRKLLSTEDLVQTLGLTSEQVVPIVSELVGHRLLNVVQTEAELKYEIVHDYMAQEVWQWLTVAEKLVKAVQEMLDTETRFWHQYHEPIQKQKLEAIYANWDDLVLQQDQLELVWRSSVTVGMLKEWDHVASGLGSQVVALHRDLVSDQDLEVAKLSAIALAQMGLASEVRAALGSVSSPKTLAIRTALHELEAGRPPEDFLDEKQDREWKERSIWSISTIIGLDFGTTSSAIAVSRNGKPLILPNLEGSKFTPSVVAFTQDGNVVVGSPAVAQAPTNTDRTFFNIKRYLGTDWQVEIDGMTLSAVDIAAHVFRSLKKDAESYTGRSVRQAVLTAPAYFNQRQREAIRESAELAGLEVVRMIAEPTAAALAHGLNDKHEREVAVYDLGGGTFDISMLSIDDGVFEVNSVNGNASLGGVDFDQRIVEYLLQRFHEEHDIDLSGDKVARLRVKEEAERAKIALSGLAAVRVYIPFLYADEKGGKPLDVLLSRSIFEELTHDLLDATIECCREAFRDARFVFSRKLTDLDEVVLVGLSTKIPSVRRAVRELFGKEPVRGVDPDEAVALGAAIQGGILSGQVRETLLLDVTPLTLGLELADDVAEPLIPRNTTIPTKKSAYFTTVVEGQTSVEVHLLQGEHPQASRNLSLGRFTFEGVQPLEDDQPKIEVTFDIDANGLLVVKAMDLKTGESERRIMTVLNTEPYVGQQDERLLYRPLLPGGSAARTSREFAMRPWHDKEPESSG